MTKGAPIVAVVITPEIRGWEAANLKASIPDNECPKTPIEAPGIKEIMCVPCRNHKSTSK